MRLWLLAGLALSGGCVFITDADRAERIPTPLPPTPIIDPSALDADGDGFVGRDDCDDDDPSVFPGAEELPNQIDDDCDGVEDNGTIFYDDDGDGFCESTPCNADCGLSVCGGDCDDTTALVYPGADEICDGGIQNDCTFDGNEFDDRDGDGYSVAQGDPDDRDVAELPTDVTSIRASIVCDVVRIEPGTYDRGCEQPWCAFDEGPVHEVTITRPLLVMETEVLRFQWDRLVGPKNWAFPDCGENCPVTRVSFPEALAFANVMNDSLQLPRCEIDDDPRECVGWRLPTEAEWEWFARGTSQDRFAGGSNAALAGWIADNSDSSVHPARLRQTNINGLWDVTGNVWEWTWDAPVLYPFTPEIDPLHTTPTDLEDQGMRVLRGASARTPEDQAHVTSRAWIDADSPFYDDLGDDGDTSPVNPFNYHGFRMVRNAP
jgi:formylglycine-generating enzyme required for sulfatase activity